METRRREGLKKGESGIGVPPPLEKEEVGFAGVEFMMRFYFSAEAFQNIIIPARLGLIPRGS